MSAFTVRMATPADRDAFAGILRDGDAAMRRLGNGRWDGADIAPDRVTAWIEAGEAVVALAGEDIAATMLLQWRDLVFWPERDDGTAAYLHKIAVRAGMNGRGAPAALVAFAADEARRRGRTLLRLDTGPWPRLCAVYERLGFCEVDRLTVNGRPSVRFEQQIA